MKISKEQLNKIHEIALYNYRQDSNKELSAEGLVAQAWVKSAMSVLFPEVTIEFPNRIVGESIFDD